MISPLRLARPGSWYASPPMPAPTNLKKQSLMPSTPLRRKLRGHGHALPVLVHIGKEGVTAGVCKQLAHVLFDHELVKVKIAGECPESRFEVAAKLSAEPGVNVVQILGRTIVVYKRHPEKPRFEGPRAKPTAVGAKPA